MTAHDFLKARQDLNVNDFDNLVNHIDALSWIANHKISGPGGPAGEAVLRGLEKFGWSGQQSTAPSIQA